MERDGSLEPLSLETDLNQRNKIGMDKSIDDRTGIVIITLRIIQTTEISSYGLITGFIEIKSIRNS